MHNESIRYVILPGWQGSADDHWQTHWQNSLPNSVRVEQADWLKPRREDWVGELQRTIAADSTPVILIAHSLGCVTVAHWAQLAPLETSHRFRSICCRSRLKWSAPITTLPSVPCAPWKWPVTGALKSASSAEAGT